MPFFVGDPFDPFPKKLIVKPTDKQLADMIEKNIEDFTIYKENEKTTLSIADTFWNRRKLKKLKISFKKQWK